MFNNNKDKYILKDGAGDANDDVTVALKPGAEIELPNDFTGKPPKTNTSQSRISSVRWKVIPAVLFAVVAVTLMIGLTYNFICCSDKSTILHPVQPGTTTTKQSVTVPDVTSTLAETSQTTASFEGTSIAEFNITYSTNSINLTELSTYKVEGTTTLSLQNITVTSFQNITTSQPYIPVNTTAFQNITTSQPNIPVNTTAFQNVTTSQPNIPVNTTAFQNVTTSQPNIPITTTAFQNATTFQPYIPVNTTAFQNVSTSQPYIPVNTTAFQNVSTSQPYVPVNTTAFQNVSTSQPYIPVNTTAFQNVTTSQPYFSTIQKNFTSHFNVSAVSTKIPTFLNTSTLPFTKITSTSYFDNSTVTDKIAETTSSLLSSTFSSDTQSTATASSTQTPQTSETISTPSSSITSSTGDGSQPVSTTVTPSTEWPITYGINVGSGSLVVPGGFRDGQASDNHSCHYVRVIPQSLRNASLVWHTHVPKTYEKYTEAYGIYVFGTANVSDASLQRACYTIRFLLSSRYDTRNAFYKFHGTVLVEEDSGLQVALLMKGGDVPPEDAEFQGVWTTVSVPTTTVTTDRLSCRDNKHRTVHQDESIRKLSHAVRVLGAQWVIPGFESRLTQAYSTALQQGKFEGLCMLDSIQHYFAQGAEIFFGALNVTTTIEGKSVMLYDEISLQQYDEGLSALLSELFPCQNTFIDRCSSNDLGQELSELCTKKVDVPGICNVTVPSRVQCGPIEQTEALCVARGCCYHSNMCYYSKLTDDCLDKQLWCPASAARGDCETDPGRMHTNCKLSCSICISGSSYNDTELSAICQDLVGDCFDKALKDQCVTQKKDMEANCPLTCGFCSLIPTTVTPETTTPTGITETVGETSSVQTTVTPSDITTELPILDPMWPQAVASNLDFYRQHPHGSMRSGEATDTDSCDWVRPVPQSLRDGANMFPSGIPAFYQKYTEAYGIPILGSENVTDEGLMRACYTTRFMLSSRYDIRNCLYKFFIRIALIADNEQTTSLWEYRDLDASYWDVRTRGVGPTFQIPMASVGDDNQRCTRQDRYPGNDIFVHEFAHAVDLYGARFVIPGFSKRLKSLYDLAVAEGRYNNTYMGSNMNEYWAVATEIFFETYKAGGYTYTVNGSSVALRDRHTLALYDPGLVDLLQEVYPCPNKLIYKCHYKEPPYCGLANYKLLYSADFGQLLSCGLDRQYRNLQSAEQCAVYACRRSRPVFTYQNGICRVTRCRPDNLVFRPSVNGADIYVMETYPKAGQIELNATIEQLCMRPLEKTGNCDVVSGVQCGPSSQTVNQCQRRGCCFVSNQCVYPKSSVCLDRSYSCADSALGGQCKVAAYRFYMRTVCPASCDNGNCRGLLP